MKSSFAEHIIQTNHTYKNLHENMEILDFEIKGETMNCKEDYYISINSKTNPNNILNTTHTHTHKYT